MKNILTISKIFASLSIATGSLWLGSYLVKLFFSYSFFEVEDLSLKSFIIESNLHDILIIILPIFVTPFILYIAMIISFLLFLIISKINLKENGWLFITTLVIILTLPFELYLMTIDYDIIAQLFSSSFSNNHIIELIRKRISILSSFSLVQVFSYITIVFLIIFKPLTAIKSDKE